MNKRLALNSNISLIFNFKMLILNIEMNTLLDDLKITFL